jgi:hypothetical protein
VGLKFGRVYSLTVSTIDNTQSVTIALPFTMEFDIKRNDLSSLNQGSIRLYNLSLHNRAFIRQDEYTPFLAKRIVLRAGYSGFPNPNVAPIPGSSQTILLNGLINHAWSIREGNNFITNIEFFDLGHAATSDKNTIVFNPKTAPGSFVKGMTKKQIITQMVNYLRPVGITLGTIGNFTNTYPKARVFAGSVLQGLSEISGGQFYIDNGVANCLADNEVVEGDPLLIDSSTGLLGTPIKDLLMMRFQLLFEPKILMSSLVNLQSTTASQFNGVGKVLSLHHKGTISAAVCGDATTDVGILIGAEAAFNQVPRTG